MTTYEWLSLIVVLLGGFYTVTQKLSKLETALASRVSYDDCSVKRDKCPCVIERNDRIRDDLNRTREIINHKEA